MCAAWVKIRRKYIIEAASKDDLLFPIHWETPI